MHRSTFSSFGYLVGPLANDLPQLGDPRRPGDVDLLHAALTRLRARLRPR